jgi:AraC family transcriptional regulator of adaptative response / methylphosphotriester-DNA alkyltransferase methyltransferase
LTKRTSTAQLQAAIFRDASAILAAELERPLDVADLARRVATSPRQLQRAFKEVGGISCRDYLTRARMVRAHELLLATSAPIKDVAAQVGYREPAQFTKAYKRAHGLTPSAHRPSVTERVWSQPANL